MNAAQREVIGNRLHVAVTLLALWLVTTSPWVSMLRRVPASAGFFDYAHMVLGVVALCVGAIGEQQEHFDTLQRFGRYPYRNAALGRVSTAEELTYLAARR